MKSTGTAIALITGGSRGLGRNIALKLAEQGTDIILTYKSDERSAQEVVKLVQAQGRRAVALQLAGQGTDIILTYKSDERSAQEVVRLVQEQGRRAVALQLDASDTGACPAFVQKVAEALARTWQRDRFDKLVSNAGTGVYAPFAETTEAQFDELVAIHLKAPFFLTQKLLPLIGDGGSRGVHVDVPLRRRTQPTQAVATALRPSTLMRPAP